MLACLRCGTKKRNGKPKKCSNCNGKLIRIDGAVLKVAERLHNMGFHIDCALSWSTVYSGIEVVSVSIVFGDCYREEIFADLPVGFVFYPNRVWGLSKGFPYQSSGEDCSEIYFECENYPPSTGFKDSQVMKAAIHTLYLWAVDQYSYNASIYRLAGWI